MLRSVAQIMMILMASTMLWFVAFGDFGKRFMWAALEPVFQSEWRQVTLDDGKKLSNQYQELFDSLQEYTD